MYKLLENKINEDKIKNFSNKVIKKTKNILFSEYEVSTKASIITEDALELLVEDEKTGVVEIDYNFLLLDTDKTDSLEIRLAFESALKEALGLDISLNFYPATISTDIIEIEGLKFIINVGILYFDEIYYSLIVSGQTNKHAFWFPIPNSAGYIEQIKVSREYKDDYLKIKELYLKEKNEYKDDLLCPYKSAFCYILAVNNVSRILISKGTIKPY